MSAKLAKKPLPPHELRTLCLMAGAGDRDEDAEFWRRTAPRLYLPIGEEPDTIKIILREQLHAQATKKGVAPKKDEKIPSTIAGTGIFAGTCRKHFYIINRNGTHSHIDPLTKTAFIKAACG